MTIPQSDNRGPPSGAERRKVTFAGDTPDTGPPLPPPVTTVSSGYADDHATIASGDLPSEIKLNKEPSLDIQRLEGSALSTISSLRLDKQLKDNANKNLYDSGIQDLGESVATSKETSRSALPLLNFLKASENASSPDRSRKLSLNLSKPAQRQISLNQASEKLRRHSQPQKSYYQRVPQEDPSPPPRDPPIFTLQQEQPEQEEDNFDYKYAQHLSTHSAEVHATFNDEDRDAKRGIACTSGKSTSGKKVLFGKSRHLAQQSNSSSCKSLDDLALVHHHGEAACDTRAVSAHRSASSEDLSASSRRLRGVPAGGSGGNPPRRQPTDPHPSPGSPSRCCLVSVSRVPMAAASSHLTLDSDYQTVRLAVLGAPGVGKSSIVRQFVMQQFMEEYVPTEQRQVFCPAVIINEHLYEVRIIDCPYIPYFPVNSLYEWTDFRGYGLRNATAYVLVYDITSEESFEYIKSLRLQILESRNCHDVPIFVVGNKHDLAEERGVPRREVREVANMVKKQWKCGYIECSAKYNWHIMLLFKELMKTVDYIDYGHKPTSMRVQDALRRNRCLIL